MPEETFGVEIADGKLSTHDHDDWFTSRVPVMPAASGPVYVVGANRGDVLEVEILGLTPDAPSLFAPVLITVAVTADVPELGRVMVQAAAPCGGLVRLPALQSGGMLTFGPCSPSSRGLSCSGVSAQAIVRCSVFNTLDH
jgi:acetamidase/formamidase